jgi:tRNA pseudouridine38-40 synthase
MEFIAEPSNGDGQAGVIHISITGNGFLYNMVRIIVGTLLQIGQGKRSGDDMQKILLSRDRQKAGPTAMAHGLTLWEVSY